MADSIPNPPPGVLEAGLASVPPPQVVVNNVPPAQPVSVAHSTISPGQEREDAAKAKLDTAVKGVLVSVSAALGALVMYLLERFVV